MTQLPVTRGPRDRGRALLPWLGVLAAGAALLGVLMAAAGLARGVHCLECSRDLLGESYSAWAVYFRVKLYLFVVGLSLGAVALPLAARRRFAAVAVVFSLLHTVFLTMR